MAFPVAASAAIALLLVGSIDFGSTAAAETAVEKGAKLDEWPLIGGNNYEQHYSSLAQINVESVAGLKLAWYADMPTPDGLTGIPLVSGNAVYQSGGLGKAWANDVRTGKQLWEFDAQIRFPLPLLASWGVRVSRGLAVWGDYVLKATGDCRLFALDRRSGKKIWEVTPCDVNDHKTITGAPRVGDGKVFIGNSNADSGIGRGYVDAYEIATGKHLWRFYVIPGDPGKGFESPAMEMASKTWGPKYWERSGGGSPWDGITYDPRTRLVLIGTDGPAPFSPKLRGANGGDELFTNAIVAVKADTGEYVWHYSTTPGDGWNFAATEPVVLADLQIQGRKRAVVMSAPKNGFFYVHDAFSGKLLNEPKSIVYQNWASRIDMSTGHPVLAQETQYWNNPSGSAIVFPNPMGGAHGWMPMSYSPKTGLVYIPVMDSGQFLGTEEGSSVGDARFDVYYSRDHGGRYEGDLIAWDPLKQKEVWRKKIGRPYEGGTLATAGGLVFQGRTEGEFAAYRADTGEKVWSFTLDSGILGAPSTVEIDGQQLVLVAAGSGSTSSILFAPDFEGHTIGPARLLAFSLQGSAKLPPPRDKVQPFGKPPAPEPDATLAALGSKVYDRSGCDLCHGANAQGGVGSVPELRRIDKGHLDLLPQILRGGLFTAAGMPDFKDEIKPEEIPALRAFILQQAWTAYRQQK
jgi:PQQ-dependent dehydrogenase (methanol/ethanol family)